MNYINIKKTILELRSKGETYKEIQEALKQKGKKVSVNTIGYHIKKQLEEKSKRSYYRNLLFFIQKIQSNEVYLNLFSQCFFQPLQKEKLIKELKIDYDPSLYQYCTTINRDEFEVINNFVFEKNSFKLKPKNIRKRDSYFFVDFTAIHKSNPAIHKNNKIFKLYQNPVFRLLFFDVLQHKKQVGWLWAYDQKNKITPNKLKTFLRNEDNFFRLLTTFLNEQEFYEEPIKYLLIAMGPKIVNKRKFFKSNEAAKENSFFQKWDSKEPQERLKEVLPRIKSYLMHVAESYIQFTDFSKETQENMATEFVNLVLDILGTPTNEI